MAQAFATIVEAWANKVPGAINTIRQISAQDITAEMQTPVAAGGHMRIDTGFMRASLLASTSQMPEINPAARPADGAAYAFNDGQIEMVILGLEETEPLYLGYTAAYAGIREYHDGFVRLAGMNWKEIVYRNAAKVRSALHI